MDEAPPAKNGDGVSNTRLYLGNLPRNATKADVERHFNTHGAGEITEIKLMNGFGFVEYKDAMDARDVVPAFHGSDFMGERLVVQFARGSTRQREGYEHQPRVPPRPRRTIHRMTITGLPVETSWQDLKDFARISGLDVVYSEVNRDRDHAGLGKGFVEYETATDLESAVEKLDGSDFKGSAVHCIVDTQSEVPRPPRERLARSRSPGYRGGRYGQPPSEFYYDRRGPPRGWSPRREEEYRRRTPPYQSDHRDDYRYPPPPPRRGPEDYPPGPPRGSARYDDRYGGPPPPPRYDQEQYHAHGRDGYGGRPLSPRRDHRSYDVRGGYDSRPYW